MKTFFAVMLYVTCYSLIISCSWNNPFKSGRLNYLGPVIQNVSTISTNSIEIIFCGDINPEDALNYSNYFITDLTIDNNIVLSDTYSVRVTTGTQEKDKIYTLVITNIRDKVYGAVIDAPYNEKEFIGID